MALNPSAQNRIGDTGPTTSASGPAPPRTPSPWLFSRAIDLLALVLPIWATWVVCFLLPEASLEQRLPLWVWAVFIVGIDVSHVWSTIFRTYLDRQEFASHRLILVSAPALAFGFFFIVATMSTLWFWRLMAYLAVYHFVRQQFGFFALYKARSPLRAAHRIITDNLAIYIATLYPITFWHVTDDRAFDWFVSGDFFSVSVLSGWLESLAPVLSVCNVLYWAIIICWCAEELYLARRADVPSPLGRMLWLLGTAGTWYLGIIHFNSDLVFTLTNVIAHGVPYLALVFVYVQRKSRILHAEERNHVPLHRNGLNILFMLGVVLLLAFGEEYLWDLFLYQERGAIFEAWFTYPIALLESPFAQALTLALLSVPQVTHYVIDGHIWKNDEKNPYLKRILA